MGLSLVPFVVYLSHLGGLMAVKYSHVCVVDCILPIDKIIGVYPSPDDEGMHCVDIAMDDGVNVTTYLISRTRYHQLVKTLKYSEVLMGSDIDEDDTDDEEY